MIVIAFDFGTKRIGAAVGENILNKARPLNTLKAHNGAPNWDAVKRLLKHWEPQLLIVGLPLNINGTKQKITKKSEKFAFLLKYKFNIIVKMHDERLSTVEAKSIMFQTGGFKKLNRDNIHSFSAVIILESWLNKKYV
ncbi:Holliday junction resolvase [Buchnera aphidicola (Diuraphis noxia)]|uniref:Putative pre-16S rRNA nuclease n=1 Tax=Buchnera aphidicola subsp. Diuraphis noxia TaxID=118101 RepID=A0A1B2H929_BUCDN|nr:Holliday junction resolvase RuvX [Buchnera aphidicola]ANZ22730.1 Holliday junction resolvase [Buchnera aphidicola (Diuraphis noxia)]